MTVDRVSAGSDQRGTVALNWVVDVGGIRLPEPEGRLCSADASGTNLVQRTDTAV
jgi:hypothetical protein